MARRLHRALQIRVQAIALPKKIKPDAYLKRLIQSVDTLEPLPYGWEVRLHWRNPDTMTGATKNWQDGEFSDVVNDSSDVWGPGFSTVLRGMLLQKLSQVRFGR